MFHVPVVLTGSPKSLPTKLGQLVNTVNKLKDLRVVIYIYGTWNKIDKNTNFSL
jgi:hypothetical protein